MNNVFFNSTDILRAKQVLILFNWGDFENIIKHKKLVTALSARKCLPGFMYYYIRKHEILRNGTNKCSFLLREQVSGQEHTLYSY